MLFHLIFGDLSGQLELAKLVYNPYRSIFQYTLDYNRRILTWNGLISCLLMPTSMQIFSKNLRDLREKRGWSQQELAERADVAMMTISKYERGVNWPREEFIAKLAKALGVRESRFWLDPDLIDPQIAMTVLQNFIDRHKPKEGGI